MDFNKLFGHSNNFQNPDFSSKDGLFKQQNVFLFQEAFFKMMLAFCFSKIMEQSEDPGKDKEYLIDSWRESIEVNMDNLVKGYEQLMENPAYKKAEGVIDSPGDLRVILTGALDIVEDNMRKLLESF